MSDLKNYSIADLNNEIQSRFENTIHFKKFKLTINPTIGGGVYRSNEIYAGTNDRFYSILKKIFDLNVFIDIGANIGLSTLEVNTVFPEAKKILIEPNKCLTPLIRINLEQNNVVNYRIINCIVGDKECEIRWQRNLNFCVDSRVTGLERDFKYEIADQITLQSILDNNAKNSDSIFIKIDTQGYEERVIIGGLDYLKNNHNYYIKMEFAPFWLESQGTNPRLFLDFLIGNFDVAELHRISYKTRQIKELFDKKLLKSDVDNFIKYVKYQGKDDKGWVELLIKNHKML